ncbi:MAG: hypothetical protein JWN15_2046 [Firmicutes bacterium]|nr:hypothetical protein [Bacillota bacterium]
MTWEIIGGVVVALAAGGFIVTRLNWFKVRKYAIDMKQVYDRHKDIQEKTEALQAMGQNAPQVLMKQRLRELIAAMQSLIADMDKVKAPEGTRELHKETLTMHKESLELYQVMLAGGMGQKALEGRQKRLMKMQTGVQARTEKIYGKPKEKKKKS